MKKFLISISLLLISCADTITTKNLALTNSIPSKWQHDIPNSTEIAGKWWEAFEDSTLNNVFQEFLLPEAIYITHAHIGHYSGLMYFGREALGSKNLLVKVLPKMSKFLKANGPWSQLVTLNNIQIQNTKFDKSNSNIRFG